MIKTTTSIALGTALTLLSLGTAHAKQPTDFGNPTPTPDPAPTPEPTVEPTPAPTPVYNPPTPEPVTTSSDPAPAPTAAEPGPSDGPIEGRPEGMTLGLGFGYNLPADVFRMDQVSARIRLDSGLTLEPIARLQTASQATEMGTLDSKNAQNQLVLGSNVRMPIKRRGKVTLVGQAGAAIAFDQNDPDGGDNNNTNLLFTLDWGVGLEWWFNPQWCLSVTGRNPFFSYSSATQENGEGVDDTNNSNTNFGVIWDPGFDIAVHLFL